MTKIYGHRGSKGHYPENSMLAFEKAIEAGVHGIELDVHLTKDGEIVVIHDATLDRTTTGSGYIKDYTLADIREFSVGAKFTEFKYYNESWNAQVVPTLEEVLILFKMHDLEVNIELKTYEISYVRIEEKLLDVIQKTGYDKERIVHSSFHLPTLLRLQKLDRSAKIAWLLASTIPMPQDYLEALNFEALHMDKDVVLNDSMYWYDIVDRLRIWIVNDVYEMKQLIELGVDAIITDYPDIAVSLLEE